MFKPYNIAQVTFDMIRDIGQAGSNSKTYISHDHQLNAEIVTKQIAKTTLIHPQTSLTSPVLYMPALIRM